VDGPNAKLTEQEAIDLICPYCEEECDHASNLINYGDFMKVVQEWAKANIEKENINI